jgi:hypothetical protein
MEAMGRTSGKEEGAEMHQRGGPIAQAEPGLRRHYWLTMSLGRWLAAMGNRSYSSGRRSGGLGMG